MADDLHDLARVEHRMAAVRAVETVTRAMWALARAQQPQVEAAAGQASAYLDVAESIVTRLAGAPRTDTDDAHTLWVLLGPERPFCGPLSRMLLDQLPDRGQVGLVGHRLADVARHIPELSSRVRFRVAGASTPDELGARADRVASEILATGAPTVMLLYPTDGTPTLRRTALLSDAREPESDPPESFLPVGEVLEAAVVEAVGGRLAVALAEALRAEVVARLVATEAARRACERQLETLRHAWRVLRQDTITQELLELSASLSARRSRSRRPNSGAPDAYAPDAYAPNTNTETGRPQAPRARLAQKNGLKVDGLGQPREV